MIDTSQPSDSAFVLEQVSNAFKKHRRLFVQVFCGVLLIAIAFAYIKRPNYEATARLLVKLDQRGISLSPTETHFQIASKMAEEAVATEAEMLGGADLIAEVVDVLGPDVFKSKKSDNILVVALLDIVTSVQEGLMDSLSMIGLIPKESPKDKTIRIIKKDLTIFPVRRTQVIELAFKHKNAEATQKVLSTLIDLHSKKLARMNDYSEDYGFYQRQTAKLSGEFDASVTALLNFKEQHHIVDVQHEMAMLIQRIDNLTAILDGVSFPVSINTPSDPSKKEEGLTDPINPSQVGIPQANNDILQLATRLNDLKIERSRRATLYESNHVLRKELEVQISGITEILKKQVGHLVSTVNGYKNRLKLLTQIEPELNRLTRTTTAAEDHYRAYSMAAEERRLARDQQSRIIVQQLDAPKIPQTPVSSSRLLMVIVGLLAALLSALATVVVLEWLEAKGFIKRRTSAL